MNKNVLITIKKELRSMFRDKKTLMTMLVLPLLIPAMICVYGFLYDSIEDEDNEYKVLVNYNIDESSKNILDEMNIEYKVEENIDTIKKLYDEEEYDGYIIYTSDNNTYTIYSDESSTSGLSFTALMNGYLESYSQVLTNTYLASHGIDLNEAYNHFEVKTERLSSNNYMLIMVLSVCFLYIIMSICTSTSNMAISTTAQEKENGTLETILTFPIKKTDLIVGKYLSSVILGFITSLIALILTVVGIYFGRIYFTSFKDFGFEINIVNVILAIIDILLASMFIAGCALALTSKTKSFKEAQGKVGMLNMLTTIPLYISLVGITITDYYYAIPICNFEQLLMDIFTGSATYIHLGIAALSTIIFIIVVVKYIISAYNQEEVLFND